MDYKEDNYLMVSGIQHFEFCKRQWALIHIEQLWEENVQTIEGRFLHDKTDNPFIKEKRENKVIVRSMPIKSHKLKVTGVCDVVEFVRDERGIELVNYDGKFQPYPVEYKRGKPKKSDADLLQLTAQVICLEEMLLCEIKKAYMYYYEIRRRVEVDINSYLREKTKQIVLEMQSYYAKKHTPKVKTGPHCRNCSLKNLCLPEMLNRQTVKSYIERMINE